VCLLIDKNSKCGSLNGVWVYPTSQNPAIRISKYEIVDLVLMGLLGLIEDLELIELLELISLITFLNKNIMKIVIEYSKQN
jgi:hypothetical protein